MRKLGFLLLPALLLPGAAPAQEAEIVAEIVALLQQHSLYAFEFAAPPQTVEALTADVQRTDPYFRYIAPDEGDEAEQRSALARGIGGALAIDEDALLFVPYQDGTAFAAGLTEPGYLQAIADTPIDGLSLEEVAALVAAVPEGEKIKVSIAPVQDGSPTAYAAALPATHHVIPLAAYTPPDIEVLRGSQPPTIRVFEFTAGSTARLLRAALLALEEKPGPIVLDLRFSQGGSLFEALDSASLFIEPGLLMARTRDRSGGTDDYVSLDGGPVTTKPVVLLVGPNTISAAEVFVRTVRHYARAITVGRPTYGKCVSQKVFRLAGGARVKLTNLLILDPQGAPCDGRGVEPDLMVVPEFLYNTQKLLLAAVPFLVSRESFAVCEAAAAADAPGAQADPDVRIRLLSMSFTLTDDPYAAAVQRGAGGEAVRRVCIGPLATQAEAEALRQRLLDGTGEAYEAIATQALLQ